MDDLATDNSATAVADNPATEPAASVNGTGSTNGQALEATPGGELFQGIDPKALPPQVKAYYDSMLRDYRDKTAKLSETTKSEVTKATEAYRQKAEAYDQIAKQEEFVNQWNDYVKKVQSAPSDPNNPNDPISELKAQVQEMNQKIQQSEIAQVTEAFAEAVDEKGAKLHPEFDNLNNISIGELKNGGGDFSLLRACIELAPGNTPQERLANGYKYGKAVYDSIFAAGKKAGMGRLQMKVLNGTLPPSNAGGEPLSVTDKKPKNAAEALAMAKRGQVVSRD